MTSEATPYELPVAQSGGALNAALGARRIFFTSARYRHQIPTRARSRYASSIELDAGIGPGQYDIGKQVTDEEHER